MAAVFQQAGSSHMGRRSNFTGKQKAEIVLSQSGVNLGEGSQRDGPGQ